MKKEDRHINLPREVFDTFKDPKISARDIFKLVMSSVELSNNITVSKDEIQEFAETFPKQHRILTDAISFYADIVAAMGVEMCILEKKISNLTHDLDKTKKALDMLVEIENKKKKLQ